jgi:hypothetical protein
MSFRASGSDEKSSAVDKHQAEDLSLSFEMTIFIMKKA